MFGSGIDPTDLRSSVGSFFRASTSRARRRPLRRHPGRRWPCDDVFLEHGSRGAAARRGGGCGPEEEDQGTAALQLPPVASSFPSMHDRSRNHTLLVCAPHEPSNDGHVTKLEIPPGSQVTAGLLAWYQPHDLLLPAREIGWITA